MTISAKLTGKLACILEDCGPPESQSPEALAELISHYQPTWDRIYTAVAATPAVGGEARADVRAELWAELPELLDRATRFVSSVNNRGDGGPHHLVSDLASSLRALAQPASPLRARESWQEIRTASAAIQDTAKIRSREYPRGDVIQLGGSLEDGRPFVFGHDALTHEVIAWFILPRFTSVVASPPEQPAPLRGRDNVLLKWQKELDELNDMDARGDLTEYGQHSLRKTRQFVDDLTASAAPPEQPAAAPVIDPDAMNDKRMHEDMTLAHNARRTAIEECARLIESGAGMAGLIDQDELDQQAKYIRAISTVPDKKALDGETGV